MKKKPLLKWKYIAVFDDSKKQQVKFELDECERLKDKMKRQKKRSLIHPKIQTSIDISNPKDTSRKLEISNHVIFSYCNEYYNQNMFYPKPMSYSIADLTINNSANPIKFSLPSLVNSDISKTNNNNEETLNKKIILITDIADDTIDNKQD